jgi:predicted nucleotidyltransferase
MTIEVVTKDDLNRLESKIDKLYSLLEKPVDLTTRKGVKSYLDISDSQLSYRIRNGILQEGVHFVRDNNGYKFIPEKIKQYAVKMSA